MKHLVASDLLDLTAYELARDAFRAQVIEHKRVRRIHVGDVLAFLFEDRATLRFQIQEMVRAERIVDPAKIQLELDVYNELMPGSHELSATLMIEIKEPSEIRPMLDRLVGIDEHVALRIGDRIVQATFDDKQFEDDRLSAVQYIRFPVGPRGTREFADPAVPVFLSVSHPRFRHETELSPESRASLLRDLQA